VKYLVNEGIARWQLATGDTLLEGAVRHFGRPLQWIFLAYLLLWSFFVGSALMSAAGVATSAMCPLFDPRTDKIIYGIAHSAVAVMLVKLGGYRLFAKVMGVCIVVMFAVVVSSAVALAPEWTEVVAGLAVPTIPEWNGEGLQWTIALIGGVGGTLTVLCYGYWIREEGRETPDDLRICRIDLAVGYAMTALFGISMVIIGNGVGPIEGGGATLIVRLADGIAQPLGQAGAFARWAFLIGAWGAIFSSLLGVWQSVPYLFADFWQMRIFDWQSGARTAPVNTASKPYNAYLLAIATIPIAGLWVRFEQAQKFYAIFGALFLPMLATVLLILNGREKYIGARHRNNFVISVLLVAVVVFFLAAGYFELRRRFSG
jgi:Mn2+/Fe2+ NRAMP family transporter